MVVYLGLGSNIDDREAWLKSAVAGLSRHGVRLRRSASLYHTEPRDNPAQPWFMNTVIEADTDLEPARLLEICMTVERENGRVRAEPAGPRTIDIDVIFYDRQIVNTPDLTVPHPRYFTRRFVLEPLAEIAADFVDPARGVTVSELLQTTTDPGAVERIGPPLSLE
jgi:2-amino-4-hydroxy-6-hydroxymethyldihydropteridine diphosphokinase